MKRIVSIFLALLMLASLAGCGAKEELAAAQDALAAAQEENAALTEENTALTEKVESLGRGQEYLKDKVEGLEEELDASALRINELSRLADAGRIAFSDGTFTHHYTLIEPEHRLWITTEDTMNYQHYAAQEPYSSHLEANLLEAYAAIELEYQAYLWEEPPEVPKETWLLVHAQYTEAGELPLFWVKQSTCIPYTDENMDKLQYPLWIREGAEVKRTAPPGTDFTYDFPIILKSIDGDTAYFRQIISFEGSVSANDLIYPDPDTFTFVD